LLRAFYFGAELVLRSAVLMVASANQRIDELEAEVRRLRQVIEDQPGVSLIPVAEAARLAKVTPQTVRTWIDDHKIGRFFNPVYLVDRRLLRDHLIRRGGKLPPELIRG
jgi:hypothetical protein